MTPERALTFARIWAAVFVAVVVIHVTLSAFGIRSLDWPIGVLEAVALIFVWRHVGWRDGYYAAKKQ